MSPIERLRLPEQLPQPISHYTDAVVADDWIWISGMLAVDASGNLIGGDDVIAQAEKVHENIKAVLEKAGAGFEHVVKVTNFFVDMSHLPVFFEVRDAFVNTKAPPASTAIQVGRLARDGALFEIEAVAVIPDKATKAVVQRGSAKIEKKPAKKKRR